MNNDPRWISTAEGLPEIPGLYLATVRRLVIDPKFNSECYIDSHEIVLFYGRDFSADIDTVDGHFVRVLAWMPLPDLYKDPLDELKRKIDDFNKEEKV